MFAASWNAELRCAKICINFRNICTLFIRANCLYGCVTSEVQFRLSDSDADIRLSVYMYTVWDRHRHLLVWCLFFLWVVVKILKRRYANSVWDSHPLKASPLLRPYRLETTVKYYFAESALVYTSTIKWHVRWAFRARSSSCIAVTVAFMHLFPRSASPPRNYDVW